MDQTAYLSLTDLIARYGYLAVFVGTVLEGETVLILAGFAAAQGLLCLPWVMAVAFAGGWLGDQSFFFLGRWRGAWLMARFPRLAPLARKVYALINRWHAWLIVIIRFLYGLRIAGPLAIGMSGLAPWRFMAFNLIGAAIWAPLVAGTGYVFGQALELVFPEIRRYEERALLGVIGGLVLWVVGRQLWRMWRKSRGRA
jgi:membrane protein DedA with SNARE-associated domain